MLACHMRVTGTRLILVGFCVKDSASLDPSLATRLDDLGFELPSKRDCKKPCLIHSDAAPVTGDVATGQGGNDFPYCTACGMGLFRAAELVTF